MPESSEQSTTIHKGHNCFLYFGDEEIRMQGMVRPRPQNCDKGLGLQPSDARTKLPDTVSCPSFARRSFEQHKPTSLWLGPCICHVLKGQGELDTPREPGHQLLAAFNPLANSHELGSMIKNHALYTKNKQKKCSKFKGLAPAIWKLFFFFPNSSGTFHGRETDGLHAR